MEYSDAAPAPHRSQSQFSRFFPRDATNEKGGSVEKIKNASRKYSLKQELNTDYSLTCCFTNLMIHEDGRHN